MKKVNGLKIKMGDKDKEQIVIITDYRGDVDDAIARGWRVVSVTAGHVATGGSFKEYGKFCFVLERDK